MTCSDLATKVFYFVTDILNEGFEQVIVYIFFFMFSMIIIGITY